MHRANSAVSPRPRFGRQRQTPITLIQPRQQDRQPRFHPPKSVIVEHQQRISAGYSAEPERHGNQEANKYFTRLD
jgi:hypothetical protein